MSDVVVTLGANTRKFRDEMKGARDSHKRAMEGMARDTDRAVERTQRKMQGFVRATERGMIGLAASMAVGLKLLDGYAEKFTFARREMDKFKRSNPLITTFQRGLFGAVEGNDSIVQQASQVAADGYNAFNNFIADVPTASLDRNARFGVRFGFLRPGHGAAVEAERIAREQQDLRGQGLVRLGAETRAMQMQMYGINGNPHAADRLGARQAYEDQMLRLNDELSKGILDPSTYNEIVALQQRLLDATLKQVDAAEAKARIDKQAALDSERFGVGRGVLSLMNDQRAAALRAGGDEFGARQAEARGRFFLEHSEASRIGGVEGSIGRRRAAFTRDQTLAGLERERKEAERLLKADLERGRIAVLRARGSRDEADAMSIQLDFAERIRAVQEDSVLSRGARDSAVAELERQRDAMLGTIRPQERGSSRVIDSGIDAAVARTALGRASGGPAEQAARATIAQLDEIKQVKMAVGYIQDTLRMALAMRA